MSKKGRKQIKSRPVPLGELIRQGEENLSRSRFDDAVRALTRAEKELLRAPSGPKEQVSRSLARAYFYRACASRDIEKMTADFEQAALREPDDARYALAFGLCRLLRGEPEEALQEFEKLSAASPDDKLIERALVVCLLSMGRTREVKERLDHLPDEKKDAALNRLTALRDLLVDNFARVEERLRESRFRDSLIGPLALLRAGEIEKASERLNAFESPTHNPDRAEAAQLSTQLFYSAALSFQTDRLKEASSSLIEALRLAASNEIELPWRNRSIAYLHFIAERSLTSGDSGLAIRSWRQLLELSPQDKTASANLDAALAIEAGVAWRAGRREQAVELWVEALKSRPGNERLLRNAAIGCEKTGRKEEAIRYWLTLARGWRQQVKSKKADAQLKGSLLLLEEHLLDLMIQTGRPVHEIMSELESAMKLDPTNTRLRRKHADMCMELDRPQQALKQWEMIERAEGESADLLVHKGLALDMMRKRPAARKCFERAFELDPSNPSARRIYLSVLGNDAACADDDDDTDLAIEICNRQLSIDPGYIPAAAHLASLHFEVGEEDEGRAVIGRIIAIDPNDFNKRLYAGRIYLENGYEKEAEQEFQQAAEINPDNECLIRIGDAYLDESEFKKAARYFKKAAATASISELLDISKLLFGSKRISEAERYVDMALKKDPEHPEPHLGKAIMLLSRRKEEEGLRELDEAERLARGRREFQNTIEEAQEIKREIRQTSEISRMMGDLMNMSPGDFKSMPADIRRMLDEMMEDL